MFRKKGTPSLATNKNNKNYISYQSKRVRIAMKEDIDPELFWRWVDDSEERTECWRRQTITTEERFWAKVDRGNLNGCWPWLGRLDKDGYGQFKMDGKTKRAHRVAWALSNGPVPKGICVCHKYDMPACCNPDHLFLGTASDNVHDAMEKGRFKAGQYQLAKATCPVGHPYDEENTYRRKNGARYCKACARRRDVEQELALAA